MYRAVKVLLSLLFAQLFYGGVLANDSIPPPTLSFLVLGDWGGQPSSPYTTPAEVKLAKAMGQTAAAVGSTFTLALGDNFYDRGVSSVDDPRFKETFENVFTASALQSPWYVVCGNHDHYGNCSAEIAYSKVSNRWNFPDYYYTKDFDIPDSNSTLGILFIDTVLLTGLTHPIVRSLPPPGPDSVQAAEDQWQFIQDTLNKWSQQSHKYKWTIVAGHYPVWSVAEHGPTKILVERLKPMLEKAGVTAYFCGHDHNMQHLNDSGVQYYVVGAGHLTDPSMAHKDDVPKGSLKYYYGPSSHGGQGIDDQAGAFASITLLDTQMSVSYYDADMKSLYRSFITKP